MTTKSGCVQVTNGEESFSTWLNKPFISGALRKDLVRKNVLMVPQEVIRDYDNPVFPSGSREILTYLKKFKDKGLEADACIEENDYRELLLHNDLIRLGHFLVAKVVFPLFISVLGSYLTNKLGLGQKNTVEFEATVVKDKDSINFKYKGPADGFEAHLSAALPDDIIPKRRRKGRRKGRIGHGTN